MPTKRAKNKPKTPPPIETWNNVEDLDRVLSALHTHSVCLQTREIYLHGYTHNDAEYDELGVEFRMATAFEKNLNFLDSLSSDPILIHMHTCGGNWNDGIAIYDTIKACKSRVVLLAYSHSRSMSSIIPQAADLRILHPHTDFMIHYGSLEISDNTIPAYANIEAMKQSDEIMLDIYVERCKKAKHFSDVSDKKIRKWLDAKMKNKGDFFMTAKEAVKYGFYDGILGSKEYPTIESLRQ